MHNFLPSLHRSAEYHYRAQPIPFTHPDSPALPEHIANELFTDVSGTNGETCHQCTAIGSFFALLNDLVRIGEERGSSAVSPADVIVFVAVRAFVERHPLHDPTWRGRLRKEWLEDYARKFAHAAAFVVPRGFDVKLRATLDLQPRAASSLLHAVSRAEAALREPDRQKQKFLKEQLVIDNRQAWVRLLEKWKVRHSAAVCCGCCSAHNTKLTGVLRRLS